MNEYINFYKHIDKGLNGGLSKFFIVFAFPTIISIIVLSLGYNLSNFFSNSPMDLTDAAWWVWVIVLGLNWFILVVGVIVLAIATALLFATLSAIWEFLKDRFTGIKSLINLVKTAKEKSFDTSDVKFDNKKQEMKIKG